MAEAIAQVEINPRPELIAAVIPKTPYLSGVAAERCRYCSASAAQTIQLD